MSEENTKQVSMSEHNSKQELAHEQEQGHHVPNQAIVEEQSICQSHVSAGMLSTVSDLCLHMACLTGLPATAHCRCFL